MSHKIADIFYLQKMSISYGQVNADMFKIVFSKITHEQSKQNLYSCTRGHRAKSKEGLDLGFVFQTKVLLWIFLSRAI